MPESPTTESTFISLSPLKEGKGDTKALDITVDTGDDEKKTCPKPMLLGTLSEVMEEQHRKGLGNTIYSGVINMYVRNGSERHWESILSKLNSKAKTFPGFLSVRYIAPSSYSDGKEKEEESSKKNTNKKQQQQQQLKIDTLDDYHVWVVILKFNSFPNFRRWLDSEERQSLLQEAKQYNIYPHLVSFTDTAKPTIATLTSLKKSPVAKEIMAMNKTNESKAIPKKTGPPAKYKMALIITTHATFFVVTFQYAGISGMLMDLCNNDFGFFGQLILAIIVFIMIFCTIPLSIEMFHGPWLMNTPNVKREPFRSLVYGCDLFTPPPEGPKFDPTVIEQLERKVEALKTLLNEEHHNSIKQKDKQSKSQTDSDTGNKNTNSLEETINKDSVNPTTNPIINQTDEYIGSPSSSTSSNKTSSVEPLPHEENFSVVQTVTISWVYQGKYFEDWLTSVQTELWNLFGQENFSTLDVINEEDSNEFHLIFYFPSYEVMHTWQTSTQFQSLQNHLKPMLEVDTEDGHMTIQVEQNNSMVGNIVRNIFSDLHTHKGSSVPIKPFPVWKTFFLTWQGLFLAFFFTGTKILPGLQSNSDFLIKDEFGRYKGK